MRYNDWAQATEQQRRRLNQLKAENAELKKVIKQLKAENEMLTIENLRLEEDSVYNSDNQWNLT